MSTENIADKAGIGELIGEVRRGGQPAFIRLLALYEPMIRSTVNQFSSAAQDPEDLRQEALTAFYRAILTYDLDRPGVEFGLYAKICVNNALISQARAAKRRAGNAVVASLEHLEYDVYSGYGCGEGDDLADHVIEQENEKALRVRIEKVLSEYENRVWTLYMSGLTSREISTTLARPEKSIDNALSRIKRKLRSMFER